MVPNCFACKKRAGNGETCPHIKDCINGSKEFFEAKDKKRTRGDLLRSLSDEKLADFICSMRPDMEKNTPELKTYILNWIKEETDKTELDRCWFLK